MEQWETCLDVLQQRLTEAETEIGALRGALNQLRTQGAVATVEAPEPVAERIIERPPAPAPEPPPIPAPKPEPVPEPIEMPMAAAPEPPAVAAEAPEVETPVPVSQESAPSRMEHFESRVGMVWLNRLGIVALAIGFALLSRLIHPLLEPGHKVALVYLAAAILFGLGRWLEAKLQQFARPIMAGGLGLAFFAGYGAHFIDGMSCLPAALSIVLMLCSVSGILLCAERWRSQPTAGFALFLGHVTAFTAGSGFSLVAILMLSLCALFLMARHDWLPLSLFAVCAAFVSQALWAVQTTADLAQLDLVLNLQFLTASFAVFTAGDLLFQRKRFRGQAQGRPAAGRAVGPIALAAYVTLVLSLFRVTETAWTEADLFLLPLAALQLILFRLHQRWENPDAAFHLVSGIGLFVLGLFAAQAGLTLNLALSTLALVLYISARMLRLWYLNPVAQAVLLLQFGHYWVSDTYLVAAWPAYLGSLAAAAVYLLKARLAENGSGEYEGPKHGADFVILLRESYGACVPWIAWVHALVGAALVAQAGYQFLPPVQEQTALLIAAGILALLSFRFSGRLWTWSILALEAVLIGRVFHEPAFTTGWVQGCSGLALLAIGLFAVRERAVAKNPMLLIIALGSFACAVVAVVQGALIPTPGAWWMFAGMPVLMVVGYQAELIDRAVQRSPWRAYTTTVRLLLGLLSGAGLALAWTGAFEPGWTGYVIALVCAAGLTHLCITWRSTPWLAALFSLEGVVVLRLLSAEAVPELVMVTALITICLSGLALLRLGGREVLPRFTAGGAGCIALCAAATFSGITSPRELLPLWQLVFVGLWTGLEMLRTRHGQLGLNRNAGQALALVLALFTAGGMMTLYHQSMLHNIDLLRMALSSGMVLLVSAAIRKSWALGAGYLVAVLFTYTQFESWFRGFNEHYLVGVIIFSTLFAAACTELGYRGMQRRLGPGARTGFGFGVWIPFVFGSLFGLVKLLDLAEMPDFVPVAILALLGLCGVARLLKLKWLMALAVSWTALITVLFTCTMVEFVNEVLFAAGMVTLLELFVIERLLRQRVCRAILVGLAGLMTLVLFLLAPGIEGGWTTLGWSLAAALFTGLGFAFKDRAYRLCGLAMFGCAIARIVLIDLAELEQFYRIMAFLGLGACLVAASFLYNRFRNELHKGL